MNHTDMPAVPRRVLGRTGLSIPVIPFGTQGFGNHFGFVADEDAVALVEHAVALGVNHFDCARCYGDSLRKLGLALKEIPRRDVIITGRLCCHSGAAWGGYGAGEADFSAERVVRDVEDQLAVLGADYFDGMLIHDPPRMEPTLAKDGTLAGLLGLKAARLGAQRRLRHAPARVPPPGDRHRRRRLPALLQRLPPAAAERRRRRASGGGRGRRWGS